MKYRICVSTSNKFIEFASFNLKKDVDKFVKNRRKLGYQVVVDMKSSDGSYVETKI